MPSIPIALLILAVGHATPEKTALASLKPASAPSEADASTVSGVVVTPKAEAPAKVYTPTYKAAPHLAPGATSIGGSTTIDQIFSPEQGPRYQSSHWPTYSMTAVATSQITAQRYRAKKAADLINAGRYPEALQAAFNEGDGHLTMRIAEVCDLPMPVERPRS